MNVLMNGRLQMKNKIQGLFICGMILLAGFAIIVTVSLKFDYSAPDGFKELYGVPLVFALCTMVFLLRMNKAYSYISVMGIIGIYFIKDVLVPLFLMLGKYQYIATNSEILNYMDMAVFLMKYETICTYIVLALFSGRTASSVSKEGRFNKAGVTFDFTITIMVLLIIGILCVYPSLKDRFHTIFSIGKPAKYIPIRSWRVSGSEPLGIIDTLMRAVFALLQIIFPVCVIKVIYCKYGKQRSNKGVFWLLLLSASSFFLMTGENANSVFTAAAVLCIVCILYFKKLKRVIPFIAGAGFFGIAIALLAKGGLFDESNGKTLFFELSKTLNAYFGGPINVAAACLLKESTKKIFIASDFFNVLPFISSLFSGIFKESSTAAFNIVFWGSAGRSDQLLPGIGQGALYFGYFLAPIIPCFFVCAAIKLEKWARRAESYYYKYYFYYTMLIMIILTGGNNLSHFYRYAIRMGVVYGIFKLMSFKVPKENDYRLNMRKTE